MIFIKKIKKIINDVKSKYEQEIKQEYLFKTGVLVVSLIIFITFVIIFITVLIKNDFLFSKTEEELQPLKIIIPYHNDPLNIEDYEVLKYKMIGGDTLIKILTQTIGASNNDANLIVTSLKKTFNTTRLKSDQILTIKFKTAISQNKNSQIEEKVIIEEVRFDANDNVNEIIIKLEKDGNYKSYKNTIVLSKNLMKYRVVINDSLFASGIEAGIPQGIMLEFIKIFSFDIDFQRDLRKGDIFEVLFESYSTEDEKKVKEGDVLFASLDNDGRLYNMYKFSNAYYDNKGQSVQKSLLKTPINGARISSNFGYRKHPILGYTKKHEGKDFAAPTGTPFFAAGYGTIVKAQYFGSFGNYVKVKHQSGYETEYAHASRIAKGIKVGAKVRQGQTIAYVGTTGRSTGPHLHFGVIYNGKRINPNRVKALPVINLKGSNLDDFKKEVERINIVKNNIPNQAFKKY
ncbi:MAG: M23 family metallopeptidase [Rickettsiales bacterium]|jgi:murein DD-endopeptidase MepM/ murein hydrolase activator NlpD|nr:M23 family metallopeptidase [Rickettsiales bacterium]